MLSGAPTPADTQAAADWFATNIAPEAFSEGTLPFSFRIDGVPAAELLPQWQMSFSGHQDACGCGVSTTTFTHPDSSLQIKLVAKTFADFPAVEWLLYFENTGAEDSQLISDIKAAEVAFPCPADRAVYLHHAKGSDCKIDDFMPQTTPLQPHGNLKLESVLGRSSNHVLPFFNLQFVDSGVMCAVGWTGGWQADFCRAPEGDVSLTVGMQKTHLRLHAGEQIRSPRMLLLFWNGEPLHAHNMLRQLILQQYTPRPNGELLVGPICNAVWGENTEEQQIAKAKWWVDNNLPLDCFWIDAGWYGDGRFREDSTVFNSEWGAHVGNWWPNKGPYPNGLRPVGQALRDMGLGFVLWMEPERIYKGTYFTKEHPEWLLGPVGDDYLFNLGRPEARQAMTDLISGILEEGMVTCYRQDFNTEPAPFWEAADGPDRVGMSEIFHIQGLYQMWDELLERHEGLFIDNCSSGGRRIDLEMISRSIALWRSDFPCWRGFDPVSMQVQTQGLGMWVPLSTGCCDDPSTYAFRSALGPGMVLTTNIYERDATDFADVNWLREMMNQQVRVRPYFYGDFYPLLSWSLANDLWTAWQWHRPDLGEGCLIALRRPQSPITTVRPALQGLKKSATYELQDLDGGEAWQVSGKELLTGFELKIEDQPGSKVLVYRKV